MRAERCAICDDPIRRITRGHSAGCWIHSWNTIHAYQHTATPATGHWVYAEAPTGVVHLADFVWTSVCASEARTLCGASVRDTEIGDETRSGVAATCGTCSRLARSKREAVR